MIKRLPEREVNASSRAIVDKINELAEYSNQIERILRDQNQDPNSRVNWLFNKLEEKYG